MFFNRSSQFLATAFACARYANFLSLGQPVTNLVQIVVSTAPNRAASGVFVTNLNSDETPIRRYVQQGHVVDFVDNDQVFAVVLESASGGNWSAIATSPWRSRRVDLTPLPSEGPLGWWHHFVGINTPNIEIGAGVSIGVIDEGLEKRPTDTSIDHVEIVGEQAPPFDAIWANRGWLPRTDHGNAVTSLVFARCDSAAGYQGIAPGARGYFVPARLPQELRPDGLTRRGLNPGMVANGIRDLSLKFDCDIITVSAGDSRMRCQLFTMRSSMRRRTVRFAFSPLETEVLKHYFLPAMMRLSPWQQSGSAASPLRTCTNRGKTSGLGLTSATGSTSGKTVQSALKFNSQHPDQTLSGALAACRLMR